MKKLLSLALAAATVLSCTAMAFAAETRELSTSPTGGQGEIKQHIQYVDFSTLKTSLAAEADEDIVTLTELTNSAIGGDSEYHFENIIVVRADIAALSNITNVLVPAHTIIYFDREIVANARMTVHYIPADLPLYFGLATNNDGTGYYISNEATGGYGRAAYKPADVGYYYPYLGNTADEPIVADFEYTTLG